MLCLTPRLSCQTFGSRWNTFWSPNCGLVLPKCGDHLRILAYNWRDIAHPNAGGAEVYLHAVAREWVALGHTVTIFSAAVEGASGDDMVDGVRVVRRGGRLSVYREAKRYWRRVGQEQYDTVIDCVNTKPFLCPRFVERPVLAIIHQMAREVWAYETRWPISWLGRYVLEPYWLQSYRATPVVTVSESSKRSLVEAGLRDVTVVPEGWYPPKLGRSVPKEAVPTLVFVGRLSANKRPDHAISAFSLFRERHPDAQLWVIGSGPEEVSLRRRQVGGVTFLGRLPEEEKLERLARAHALVVTSVREGWGLVVTEAASVGTPTVAYDVAGLRDSVPISGGMLCDQSPKSMARALHTAFDEWYQQGPGRVHPMPAGVVPWRVVAESILALVPSR